MTIAPTLQKYMDEQGIRYDLVPHEPTLSALGSAHAGHILSDRLAKAVVLSDGGRCTLAVLLASHHLQLSDLRTALGHEVHHLRLADHRHRGEVEAVEGLAGRQTGLV